MHRVVIAVLLLLLAVTQADTLNRRTGRKLLQSGERPAHDYAQSVSLQATHTAIERMMTSGARQASVQQATALALSNAQTSTKSWPKGSRYNDGMKTSKPAGGGDDDK